MLTDYEWLNVEKSRYYKINIRMNEENGIVVSHAWGGCYSNRGGKKNIFIQSTEEAKKYIDKMKKRRKYRGYFLISPKIN